MRDNIRTLERFNFRKVLLGVVAVLIVSWLIGTSLELPTLLSEVLATQIVLFVLLFRRPVWAMAALVVGQLTTSSSMLSLTIDTQVSIRFLWTVMALILLVPILKSRGGIHLGPQARRVLIPAIIFFVLATIANLLNTDLPNTVQYLRIVCTNLTILILLPATVDNERDVKTLTLVALLAGLASAIVAIMQHYTFLGLPALSLYPEALDPSRVSGLAEGAVHLSYQLPILLVPLLSIYFLKGAQGRARQLLALAGLIILVALYFTFTRSGMYALLLGLLALVLIMKGNIKKELFLATLILCAAFLYYVDWQNNRYSQGFATEESAALRLVLWDAGTRIAFDNPVFGIGDEGFMETSSEYSSVVSPRYVGNRNVAGALGSQEVHNDFLRVWASFGTPALLAFLWMFVGIFRNFLDAYRHASSKFLKSLALGCFAAMAAYVVSAFVHNVMGSMALLWILGGLSIATTKLALTKQAATVKEIP